MRRGYLLFLLPPSTPKTYPETLPIQRGGSFSLSEYAAVRGDRLCHSGPSSGPLESHSDATHSFCMTSVTSVVWFTCSQKQGQRKTMIVHLSVWVKILYKNCCKSFSRSSSAWKDTALYKMPYVAWRSFPFRLQFMNSHKPVKRSKNKCPNSVSQRECFLNWTLSLYFLFMPGAVTAK